MGRRQGARRLPGFICLAWAATWLALNAFAAEPARKSATAKLGAELPDTSDSARGLDLARLQLAPVYEADFTRALKFMKEAELFTDDKRVRMPEDADWVLEGGESARLEQGRLHLKNGDNHLVFWNTREFPADFLLEFGVSPLDANNGLNIVFFSAKGREGGSIFALDQPKRDGLFKTYHSGGLDSYHVSYWAVDPKGDPRGTAHIRKNHGFHLVAKGRDFMAGQGAGPHRVRVLKVGSRIEVEVAGKLAVRWVDDGKTYGPVLHGGFLGLRQMSHSKECNYTHFKVWEVKAR